MPIGVHSHTIHNLKCSPVAIWCPSMLSLIHLKLKMGWIKWETYNRVTQKFIGLSWHTLATFLKNLITIRPEIFKLLPPLLHYFTILSVNGLILTGINITVSGLYKGTIDRFNDWIFYTLPPPQKKILKNESILKTSLSNKGFCPSILLDTFVFCGRGFWHGKVFNHVARIMHSDHITHTQIYNICENCLLLKRNPNNTIQ